MPNIFTPNIHVIPAAQIDAESHYVIKCSLCCCNSLYCMLLQIYIALLYVVANLHCFAACCCKSTLFCCMLLQIYITLLHVVANLHCFAVCCCPINQASNEHNAFCHAICTVKKFGCTTDTNGLKLKHGLDSN